MYRREKPITLKSSASFLCNNLSAFINTERGSLNYAVVHKYLINIVSSSTDGSQVTNKQVICKEPSATQQSSSMIMQAKWVSLSNSTRTVLVLTSLKGIQMFDYDGSAMLYWHAIGDLSSSDTANQSNFGRGVASVGDNICVGTQEGHILVFNIPAKGTNVTLKDTAKVHKAAICDLASEFDTMVSSDDDGNIALWKCSGSSLHQTGKIPGVGDPCSSLGLWKGIVVAAYGQGQIKTYSMTTGKIGASVNAHARWINAISIAKDTGLLLSASEDSFVRVWQLIPGSLPSIEFKYADCVTDLQLVGAQFIQDAGKAFCVTGYDSSDLIFYVH